MKKVFTLQPFVPVPLDLNVTGEIDRTANQLTISYRLAGDLSQVLIPAIAAIPRRCFELWEATCFEFFLAPVGESYYWEFNLSPSGDWNVFRLDDYRQGLRNESAVAALPVVIQQTATLVTLNVQLSLEKLVPENQALDIAITTVIQNRNSDFSYWALQHTSKDADFHHRSDFSFKA